MKKLYIAALALLPSLAFGQIPAGYYNPAAGLSGQQLRAALSTIIRTHTTLSYTPGLWNAYSTTDKKPNGKLWDIYSDIPGGTPAYEYTLVTDQCGSASPSAEHGCYNREHTWPKSKFSSNPPMYTDLFIVYPTDYWVNNQRSNYPYGKVGTATSTFTNGSKLGNNVYPGASSGLCFEPIDSFKGDIARNYFYVATCYRNDSALFIPWEMANQLAFTSWAKDMLLAWHHLDPVSKKEIDRNNAAYAIQGNRNPFIDHPEYADCIWGTGCATNNIADVPAAEDLIIYPNPAADLVTLEWTGNTTEMRVHLFSITGQEVFHTHTAAGVRTINVPLRDIAKGMYFVHLVSEKGTSVRRITVE